MMMMVMAAVVGLFVVVEVVVIMMMMVMTVMTCYVFVRVLYAFMLNLHPCSKARLDGHNASHSSYVFH